LRLALAIRAIGGGRLVIRDGTGRSDADDVDRDEARESAAVADLDRSPS